jgi:hypothetical protein
MVFKGGNGAIKLSNNRLREKLLRPRAKFALTRTQGFPTMSQKKTTYAGGNQRCFLSRKIIINSRGNLNLGYVIFHKATIMWIASLNILGGLMCSGATCLCVIRGLSSLIVEIVLLMAWKPPWHF